MAPLPDLLIAALSFTNPVLLITWRRPHTTKKVKKTVRAAAPTRIGVACNGPNPERALGTEKVEEGIILEGDCVPLPVFFPYCAELLRRYRHDECGV